MKRLIQLCSLLLCLSLSPAFATMTEAEIIKALSLPENSTGNIADAIEEATGARGWMSADMKPIFEARVVGRAVTAVLRPCAQKR